MKRILVFLALLMVFAVGTARAGQAVYFNGESSWNVFNGASTIADNTINTSSAHSVHYQTMYGINITCTGTTINAGLMYQESIDTTTGNFTYPNGISMIVANVVSATPVVINFEPNARTNYIRFKLLPTGSHTSSSCTVYLYEQ